MAKRDRSYYRKMRAKHINRKKRIDKEVHQFLSSWYPHDGQYSKGKIHCSCGICINKTKNKGSRRHISHNYCPNVN